MADDPVSLNVVSTSNGVARLEPMVVNATTPTPTGSNSLDDPRTFSIEKAAGRLVPFDFNSDTPTGAGADPKSPLYPITRNGCLLFLNQPTISEGVNIKYDPVEVTHSNEAYYAYRSTDNVRYNISDLTYTGNTFAGAQYILAAMHFFRSYSLMDFGRNNTGRPPSPMWFYAYGKYAFDRVPVLMEKADWSWPRDVDYVGVPNPGTPDWINKKLGFKRRDRSDTEYTWVPIKVTFSVGLIAQHSPKYWLETFSLNDYKTGNLLTKNRGFHRQSGGGRRAP